MFTDNLLRLMGSLTATGAAYASGVPTGFPAGQAITDTCVSTNTIDLTQNAALVRNVGEGKALYMVWTITISISSIANITFNVIADDAADLSSPVVLASSGAIAEANLTAGTKIAVQIPPALASLGLRYLGASITCSESGTGSMCCDIVESLQDGMLFYPSGFSLT